MSIIPQHAPTSLLLADSNSSCSCSLVSRNLTLLGWCASQRGHLDDDAHDKHLIQVLP